MYQEKIFNIETGEETWRDYTSEEIAEVEAGQAAAAAEAAAAEAAAAARIAVLEKLGLTTDEIAALGL
jgi:hypothetical protein